MRFCSEYPSPIGVLLLTSDGTGLTGLWMDTQPPLEAAMKRRDNLPLFASVRRWLDAYFEGKTYALDFPLAPSGTAFQQQVWQLLLQIPYGHTTTYGTIAKAISPTMSAQAVGGAVGKNPIGIIIPCHRCIGSQGQLTGYSGGLDKKKWLLRHEEETK